MNRKLKVLGLAFVAALAMTAMTASAAQAFFTAPGAGAADVTTISGSQTETHKFTAGEGIGAINCETATFHGTAVGPQQSTLTIKPTYGPTCKDSVGRVVHILTNTLEYHFNTPASGVGTVDLTGEIVLTVTGSTHCTITIKGTQKGINGITYTNEGGTNGVKVVTHSNNITSTFTGGFFACGNPGSHSAVGTYKGATLMKGERGGKAVEIKVD